MRTTKTLFALVCCLLPLFSSTFAQTGSALTLSEVMFYPSETNGEFIEIYNTSATETIDLSTIKFKYSTSTANSFTAFIGGTNLAPGKYAVVLQGNYDYNNGIYKNLIPSDAIVLKITSNSFGSSGMANTTSREVYLVNGNGTTIDTYTYSADNNAGISDEKFLMTKDNSTSNWRNSIKLNGTPGYRNSVTPVKYLNDLTVRMVSFSPANPVEGDSVQVKFVVKNIGTYDATSFSTELFVDQNSDSVGQPTEKFYSKSFFELFVSDSVFVTAKFYAANSGKLNILANVDYSLDENFADNKLVIQVTISEKPVRYNDIVINEIMYAPTNEEPEWIELYNRSDKKINLKNWKITDNTTVVTITTTDFNINPGEYLVISGNASIANFYPYSINTIVKGLPSLGNSGDDVVLKNSSNVTIDSVKYASGWGGTNGCSLERILAGNSSTESSNWKTSTSKYKATPSKINSVTQKNNDLQIKNFALGSRYAEVGKTIQLNAVVANLGKSQAQNYSVKLFKDANQNGVEEINEQIAELSGTNLAVGASASFSFSTTNFDVGLNQFIIRVDFTGDEFTENNSSLLKIAGVIINEVKGDLVINEIMYNVKPTTQQWIEIYNNSSKTINLNGYQIFNGTTKYKVINKNIFLNPDNYFVIARDSSAFNFNPKLANVVITNFAISSGKVSILDSLNRTIDSLEYKSTWGGSSGKSLERINASGASSDSTNWKTCINSLGATPGLVNSLSKKNYDLALNRFSFNPSTPTIGQKVRVKVEISNIGRNEAVFKLALYKVNKDGSKLKLEETSSLSLAKDASLTYEFSYAIENLTAKNSFECIASYNLDEDTDNNTITSYIAPAYPAGTIVINEVMFSPLNGEPEWIELYNTSNYEVDLQDWSITDVLTTPQKTTIKAKDYSFPAKSFLVISKDSTIKNFHSFIPSKLIISSFANLNNDADGIVIKDSRGVTMDSLFYNSKMGGESGKSIERISFSSPTFNTNNWASSKDIELSTPGRINSIAIKKYDLSTRAIIPNPLYPAVNEEIKVGAKIINYGTDNAVSFSVRIYSKENNTLSLLSEISGSNLKSNDSIVVYSTKTTKLTAAKTFLCKVIYTADEDTLNNSFTGTIIPGSKQNSVLITEIMYSPLNGEPEWVEFVNASNEPINLKNWAISDLLPFPTKAVLTTKDEYLQPGEFAIATQDTHSYAYNPPKKFYQAKFGSLGNTSDGVIIYDFRNAVIDSVYYISSWGGKNGYSLERISTAKASNDSTNWVTSLSSNGASAGLKNSVATLKQYAKNSLIINEIMYEPETGKAEFVELYNPGNDTVQVGGMELTIANKNKVKLATSNIAVLPKQYFVVASDSSFYQSFPLLKNSGKVSIAKSLSLTNNETTLLVKDLYGTTLDSLCYSPTWHNKNLLVTKNKSLERINPILNSTYSSNWSTSVANEGATPAKANSIYTENVSRDSKVTISPNPFSPDNDGFEDFAIINFDLPYKLSQVRIKVFDSKGRLVKTLLENRPSGTSNSVVFNGLDDEGRALKIGIYILLIEISTETSNNVETIKTPIVIARKLN